MKFITQNEHYWYVGYVPKGVEDLKNFKLDFEYELPEDATVKKIIVYYGDNRGEKLNSNSGEVDKVQNLNYLKGI